MQTEGIGQTGLGAASDLCHFPDCGGVELDSWQAYSQSAANHAFQTDDLSDIWSTVQPGGSDHDLTPGLSSLDDRLSSFDVYSPLSGDTTVTSDDVDTTLRDAFKVNATPWAGDTFSYFYGSQYNPFGCAFQGQEAVIESHGTEHTIEAVSHVKHSYSEVAKSAPCGSHAKKTCGERLISEPVSQPVRTSKSSTQSKSHTVGHVPFDPVPIDPGSAYGLDTFATPRYVLKDRQGLQPTDDSFVAPRKHKCGHTHVQCDVNPFVTARPVHKHRRANVPSRYGLDSFDVPRHDAKHRQLSSSESGLSEVDSANVSFREDRFDVNDFYQTQSFGTCDPELHVENTAAKPCRETTDDKCGTSQKVTATLNGIRREAGDNKLSAHDRKRSRSRTKPAATNSSESNDNNRQSASCTKQSANCNKTSASKGKQSTSNSKQSANSSKQSANSKRDESPCVLNNSKPISSNGCAFRTRSVHQINNNVRDDSEVRYRTRNNNVRDDNKVNNKRHNNMQDNGKVTDRTHNNNNSVQGDSKVTDETHSSRSNGPAKTSKGMRVVKTKVDYLELLEQIHDSCTRAGQYLWEVLYKSTLAVLWLLLIIIKDICLLAVGLIIYLVLVCQSLVKKAVDKYCRQQQPGSYGNSTQCPQSGGNIELPTTGDEAVRRLLTCDDKNPYSVLGVGHDASDEDIKRFYRKQAILVHPDKNRQVGSEEAFKILQNAFDVIGDPEKREELRRTQEAEHRYSQEADAAMNDFVDQVRKEMKEAADRLMCDRCGGTHLRVATDRLVYSARYCSSCYDYHSARQDDLWAETSYGFCYSYFACMEGVIYNITEWASCQGKLSELKPNLHQVRAHLMTRPRNRTREDELDEFLRQFEPSTYNQRPNFNNRTNGPDNTWKPKSRKNRRKRRT